VKFLEFLDEFDFFNNFYKKSTEYFIFILTEYKGPKWEVYPHFFGDDLMGGLCEWILTIHLHRLHIKSCKSLRSIYIGRITITITYLWSTHISAMCENKYMIINKE